MGLLVSSAADRPDTSATSPTMTRRDSRSCFRPYMPMELAIFGKDQLCLLVAKE